MWLANKYNHKIITAYNETTVRSTGGLAKITKGTTVSLSVLVVPTTKKVKYKDSGKFIEQIVILQVSKEELSEKRDDEGILIREAFVVNVGNTHIIYRDNDYRVASILDAEYMNMVQLYQLTCIRKIPMSDLT